MRLLPIVACSILAAVTGCESYDNLHRHRHAYRRPGPEEMRPVARMAAPAYRIDEKHGARASRVNSRQVDGDTADDEIVYVQGHRPILPKIGETPVIDIRQASRSLEKPHP